MNQQNRTWLNDIPWKKTYTRIINRSGT